MANVNPIVETIKGYVDENRDKLMAEASLGGQSAKLFNLMSGVVGPTNLHTLATEITLGDGSECGFDPQTEQEISKRVVTPVYLKVNAEWCDKALLETYAQHMVKIAAKVKTLPFEEQFIADILAKINEASEKMLYQGDSDNANEHDGLVKILDGEGAVKVTKAVGTDAYTAIKEVFMSIPDTEIKADTAILVSPSLYRAYIQSLVSANLYHYDPANGANEYMLPGTTVKVIAVDGLASADKEYIIAGRLSNVVYATDSVSDKTVVDFWYSNDNRTFRGAIEWVQGVQVVFPDKMVLGSIAKQ